MVLHQDFRELLELLEKNKVEYLVVGAFAMGFYGNPRTTGDIDLWVNRTKENAEKIIKTFDDFGISSLDYKEEDFLSENVIIQIGVVPVRVDFLTSISGVNFIDAYSRKEKSIIDGIKINYLCKEDFIKNKLASGRAKDLADIESIKKTRKK